MFKFLSNLRDVRALPCIYMGKCRRRRNGAENGDKLGVSDEKTQISGDVTAVGVNEQCETAWVGTKICEMTKMFDQWDID